MTNSTSRALAIIDENKLISLDTRRQVVQAAHDAQQKFAHLVNVRRYLMPSVLIVFFGVAPVFAHLGAIGIALLFWIGAFAIGMWGYFTNEDRVKKIEQGRSVQFPCPLCHHAIDLTQSWACGNCKYEHNVGDDAKLVIPFDECANAGPCTQPYQTAFQCPKCHNHIVLDDKQYVEYESYKSPYRRVARFLSDSAAPIVAQPDHTALPPPADNPAVSSFFDE